MLVGGPIIKNEMRCENTLAAVVYLTDGAQYNTDDDDTGAAAGLMMMIAFCCCGSCCCCVVVVSG